MKASIILLLFATLFVFVQSSATVYNVKVEFNATSLQEIFEAGFYVTLASQASSNGWYSVISSFQPSIENYLSFNTSGYSSFVSVTILSPGIIVSIGESVRAAPGELYTLNYGSFSSKGGYNEPWLTQNQIGIHNNDTKVYLTGLTLDININSKINTGIVFLEEILSHGHAVFDLVNPLLIFLAPKEIPKNMLFNNLDDISTSDVTAISFSSLTDITVNWDDVLGQFRCLSCTDVSDI